MFLLSCEGNVLLVDVALPTNSDKSASHVVSALNLIETDRKTKTLKLSIFKTFENVLRGGCSLKKILVRQKKTEKSGTYLKNPRIFLRI